MEPRPKKLLDQVRDAIRLKHYAYRTEQTYVDWIERFIRFHKLRHPKEMNTPEIEVYLTHLAVERNVAPSTQNQALSALLFLYRDVLKIELVGRIDAVRAKKEKHLPTVLTKVEVIQVINHMTGLHQLMAQILYGSGMRLMECMRLRVKDLEFSNHQIVVRNTKGNEDRITMLPQRTVVPLQEHLKIVKELHVADLAGGYGTVELPYALARKCPNAEREWMWQYVFPSEKHSVAQILLTTGAAFSATASRLLTHYSVTARPRPSNRRSAFSTASPLHRRQIPLLIDLRHVADQAPGVSFFGVEDHVIGGAAFDEFAVLHDVDGV